jgi:hypothetical protein
MPPDDDIDLTFLDLGVTNRRYPSPAESSNGISEGGEHATNQNYWENLEREAGFELLGSFATRSLRLLAAFGCSPLSLGM